MVLIGKAKGLAGRLGRVLTVTMLSIALGGTVTSAQAGPLNLEFQASPSIMSDFLNITYDTDSKLFTVKGFVRQLGIDVNQATPIDNGTFELSANITSMGTFTGGTFTVYGAVPSLGLGNEILLSGDLSLLGYGDAGGVVEFLFTTNGGTFADNFGPITGVILGQCGFAGDFTKSFSSNSIAVASIGK